MSNDLLISLGHNASAVHIKDGDVEMGFEEERLTKTKSDSSFPHNAIEQMGDIQYDTIYVSHWDPFCKLENMSSKHWKPKALPDHDQIITLDQDFTHHDAHAHSAVAFQNSDMPTKDTHIIVADGFGNYGECLSIYEYNGPSKNPTLIHRSHGYSSSLGLMYQYATANLGLRMNQDEYKLLGYEAHTDDTTKLAMCPHIDKVANRMFTDIMKKKVFDPHDPLYDTSALVKTQMMWDKELSRYDRKKAHIAYFTQSVLEIVLERIIEEFDICNVILAGGVFMNVKANLAILENIPGKISVMPLSGDQGAPLGLYHVDYPEFRMPNKLNWGSRYLHKREGKHLVTVQTGNEVVDFIDTHLSKNHIVNVVKGAMEFGSRALGNTSTIMLPTKENADYVNIINGRDSIMPMAPMVLAPEMDKTFMHADRVVKSTNYMIMALPYIDPSKNIMGAAHPWVNHPGMFTGRPQRVGATDPIMSLILSKYGILINTSFNIHGQPICYSSADVQRHHEYQMEKDYKNRVYTVILQGDR